ncbi:MAG TPA: hypothetical protein ENH51_06865, partial [Euryarchaeota archaeon]|nr:hypothetical protein [Euryarchaeota archaeon]
MILSIDNIKAGIEWWHHKSNWPADLHNKDYYRYYKIRSAGINENWWNLTVDELSKWRAFRSRYPPNTKDEIKNRGIKVINIVAEGYNKIVKSTSSEPSIDDVSWEQISSLFEALSNIKPKSAVFAGKSCHFILPKVFIVMDNLGTQVFDYEFYWRGMKDEWLRFQYKDEAKELLIRNIEGNIRNLKAR